MTYVVEPARTGAEVEAARALCFEYIASLEIDLSFQDVKGELRDFPGKYRSPGGELLLAKGVGGTPMGCVGVRPFYEQERCELKRLYVRPEGRGSGGGRALVAAAVEFAEVFGYRDMVLDVLPHMGEARAIYASFGFEPIAPYYFNPFAEALFLRKLL